MDSLRYITIVYLLTDAPSVEDLGSRSSGQQSEECSPYFISSVSCPTSFDGTEFLPVILHSASVPWSLLDGLAVSSYFGK